MSQKNNLVSRVKKGQNRYTPVLKQSKNVFPPIVLLPLLMVPYCTYLETLFAIHPDSFGTAPCLTKKKEQKSNLALCLQQPMMVCSR